jgi:hypothetical protein
MLDWEIVIPRAYSYGAVALIAAAMLADGYVIGRFLLRVGEILAGSG